MLLSACSESGFMLGEGIYEFRVNMDEVYSVSHNSIVSLDIYICVCVCFSTHFKEPLLFPDIHLGSSNPQHCV